MLALFLVDVWALNLALAKRECRQTGGTPVVSDATVVCLRSGGVADGFVPAVMGKRGGR